MLYKLFSCLNSDSEVESVFFKDVYITADIISDYQRLGELRKRRIVSGIRSLNAQMTEKPDLEPQRLTLLKSDEENSEWLSFLQIIYSFAIERNESLLLEMGLRYLFFKNHKDHPLDKKIDKFFLAFLEQNPQEAEVFYKQHSTHFLKESNVHLHLKVRCVVEQYRTLAGKLKLQKSALGIAPFFIEFIEDVELFAAAILWLLQKKVPPLIIIQTHLLHDFYRVHLYILNAEESPIVHLYNLLGQFSVADGLIRLAKKTQSGERGFEQYNIMGEIHPLERLVQVKRDVDRIIVTPGLQNLLTLSELFTNHFMARAFVAYLSSSLYNEDDFWRFVLNDVEQAKSTIPLIINATAKLQDVEKLIRLALFLKPETCERLLIQQEGAILHLLPFKPDLCARVTEKNITSYIQQAIENDDTNMEAPAQLLTLFKTFRIKNEALAPQIFKALVDRMLLYPIFFDDDQYIWPLSRYAKQNNIIGEWVSRLADEFDQYLEEQAVGSEFDEDAYISIQDRWRETIRQIHLLGELEDVLVSFPMDKYRLQVMIIKKAVEKSEERFVFNDFIKAFNIQMEVRDDEKTELECLLLECLVTLDNEELRQEIESRLNTAKEERSWIYQELHGDALIVKAAREGNVGLLAHWQSEFVHRVLDLEAALESALQFSQWPVINLIISQLLTSIKRTVAERLLLKAAEQHQPQTLKLLCHMPKNAPRVAVVDKALDLVFYSGDIESIHQLCVLVDGGPSDKKRKLLCEIAIHWNRLDIVQCLLAGKNYRLFSSVFERAFLRVAASGELDILKGLMSFSGFDLKALSFYDGVEVAAVHGRADVLNYLCNASPIHLTQHVVQKAMLNAIRGDHLPCIQILRRTVYVETRALTLALELAASSGSLAIVDYFAQQYLTLPVRASAWRSASLLAAKSGRWEVVNCILQIPQYRLDSTAYRLLHDFAQKANVQTTLHLLTTLHHRGKECCSHPPLLTLSLFSPRENRPSEGACSPRQQHVGT